ncbi:Pkinase-domain-containing protein [Trametes elegans]|nr:Pkinase-domain-containing protein [Trametes elegans]
MANNGHRPSGSVSQTQNHKAQLATAYNELGKELSSQKIRVVGNYTLGKVIGEGTYGKVRLGVHRLTGIRVAIKQIPKAMSAALTREIHHHRQLHHPHVTQLYEVIATETSIWLVTELCSGGELFDYLAEKGRLSEEETRVLFGQLCLAVAYVHEKGIVHRDLKLENVLLDERCRVKLGDFGFTREFERGSLLETFCGTTGYAAPEMLLAKKYLGPEVDIWSLGVILYTLLTGTLPFDDDDESIMRDKVIKGEFDDPEWLSDDARNLLANILQVDPTKRLTIAQILTHPWFTASTNLAKRNSSQSSLPVPSRSVSPAQLQIATSSYPQPLSASTASDATFHSASSEFFSSVPTTPDELPNGSSSSDAQGIHRNASESTLKKLIGKQSTSGSSPKPDPVPEESNGQPSVSTPPRPPLSRSNSTSNSNGNGNAKLPPAFPTRTPARTKRRSVSSTLSEHGPSSFEKPNALLPPQDFSSLLHTPAPLIFSTPLERDLLNSMSNLGLDTGQIVHSVLNDACDATGALWWMLKRKTERKAADEAAKQPVTEPTTEVQEEPVVEATPPPLPAKEPRPEEPHSEGRRNRSYSRSQHKPRPEEGHEESHSSSLGRTREPRMPIPPALVPAHSAPELQLIPATPTAPVTQRSTTPPRATSPTNPLLSPSPSVAESLAKSHQSTPSGSIKEKENQGSKGRKNRAGSVSIMQRATTALEAAGLVRKKSAEAVREERERREREEKEKEKQKAERKDSGNSNGEEPRQSHGSGSSKAAKTPPMRAVKDAVLSSTPPPAELNTTQTQMGSPWVIAGKQSPPPDTGSPADTLTSLPSIPSRGNKSVPGHRNRASLLSTFQRWFREDPKGKRKEDPTMAQALAHSNSLNTPGSSPISQRRGTIKGRSGGRGKIAGSRNKAAHRAKRASVSSRRSSSVNSRRSSASMQLAVLESPPYSASVSRQRSDPSRRSFGSHTPNSELEEFMSRPSSIHSFVNHPRHRKSPSASSAGSLYLGRTSSPLPKSAHRRGGSGSSTRVVRQIQITPTNANRPPHLRSNSASSAHSRASSRPGSLYDLSETDSRRNSSPHKMAMRRSLDETPRRAHGTATFVAHKRQTPFANPNGSGYLNSLGRSSWKKSWGLEPPGWQTRSAHPAIEVLAVYPPPPEMPAGIRDVFSGRHSLSAGGDESDWVDEEDETPAYVGGLGQMPSSASSAITTFAQAEPPLPPLLSPAPRCSTPRSGTSKRAATTANSLAVGNVSARSGRGKANRSPAGRSSPLPSEGTFEADSRGGRRQLPAGRTGLAFRGIQEEDEGEEE